MSSARTRILQMLQDNVGKPVKKEDLAKAAEALEWARPLRHLRQEGYEIELLKDGSYRLNSLKQNDSGKQRINIDQKTRYRILQRDGSMCKRCGRSPEKDGVQLAIDHKLPVEWGGTNDDDNLWTLCRECNEGKKHWYSDEDAGVMAQIMAVKGSKERLKKYIELHPNELIDPVKLSVIAGTREWTRTIRFIRAETGWDIKYIHKDPTTGGEGYLYTKS